MYTFNYDVLDRVESQIDPWGITLTKFTAREFDGDVANLGYYRNRWYSADIGQLISEDPLSFAAGDANLRRYVGNEATGATDPSGLAMVLHRFGGRTYVYDDNYGAMDKSGELSRPCCRHP